MITNHPQSIEVNTGSDALFSVTAQRADLHYQLLQDNVVISGANGSQYLRKEVTKDDDDIRIHCIVSNTEGEKASNEAELIVGFNPPTIIVQPQNQKVLENSDASFTIAASGTNLEYQWQENGTLYPMQLNLNIQRKAYN